MCWCCAGSLTVCHPPATGWVGDRQLSIAGFKARLCWVTPGRFTKHSVPSQIMLMLRILSVRELTHSWCHTPNDGPSLCDLLTSRSSSNLCTEASRGRGCAAYGHLHGHSSQPAGLKLGQVGTDVAAEQKRSLWPQDVLQREQQRKAVPPHLCCSQDPEFPVREEAGVRSQFGGVH